MEGVEMGCEDGGWEREGLGRWTKRKGSRIGRTKRRFESEYRGREKRETEKADEHESN